MFNLFSRRYQHESWTSMDRTGIRRDRPELRDQFVCFLGSLIVETSVPVSTIQTSVLQRFAEIGDGEHPAERARSESHAADCHARTPASSRCGRFIETTPR